MPLFSFSDPDDVLHLGLDHVDLNLARALLLLAIATAPAPGSRYLPGSSWTVVKYGTAIEPRSRRGAVRRAAANPGIFDLDPRQKATLADDFGVALALACIDEHYGIVGIADCYSFWLQELLELRKNGRHRRMPDFVVLLDKPLNGSPIILLECKGSTRRRASQQQLRSGCGQLNNVVQVQGLGAAIKTVPRVAIAATIHPGAPVALTISDPPEPIDISEVLINKLRANYIASELATFSDLATSDRVRKAAELPTWANSRVPASILQKPMELTFRQVAFSTLPARKRLPSFEKEELVPELAKRECVARMELTASPSALAKSARAKIAEETSGTLSIPKAFDQYQSESEKIDDADDRRRIETAATTRLGTRAKLIIDLW